MDASSFTGFSLPPQSRGRIQGVLDRQAHQLHELQAKVGGSITECLLRCRDGYGQLCQAAVAPLYARLERVMLQYKRMGQKVSDWVDLATAKAINAVVNAGGAMPDPAAIERGKLEQYIETQPTGLPEMVPMPKPAPDRIVSPGAGCSPDDPLWTVWADYTDPYAQCPPLYTMCIRPGDPKPPMPPFRPLYGPSTLPGCQQWIQDVYMPQRPECGSVPPPGPPPPPTLPGGGGEPPPSGSGCCPVNIEVNCGCPVPASQGICSPGNQPPSPKPAPIPPPSKDTRPCLDPSTGLPVPCPVPEPRPEPTPTPTPGPPPAVCGAVYQVNCYSDLFECGNVQDKTGAGGDYYRFYTCDLRKGASFSDYPCLGRCETFAPPTTELTNIVHYG